MKQRESNQPKLSSIVELTALFLIVYFFLALLYAQCFSVVVWFFPGIIAYDNLVHWLLWIFSFLISLFALILERINKKKMSKQVAKIFLLSWLIVIVILLFLNFTYFNKYHMGLLKT